MRPPEGRWFDSVCPDGNSNRVERPPKSVQALGKDLRRAPDADSEVLGRFKKPAGYDGRLVVFSQMVAERFHGAVSQAGKSHGAVGVGRTFQVVARLQELI